MYYILKPKKKNLYEFLIMRKINVFVCYFTNQFFQKFENLMLYFFDFIVHLFNSS